MNQAPESATAEMDDAIRRVRTIVENGGPVPRKDLLAFLGELERLREVNDAHDRICRLLDDAGIPAEREGGTSTRVAVALGELKTLRLITQQD